jgi:hypothetical protein
MERARNHPHQNVLLTWTQVKTFYKQQSHIQINTQTNLELQDTALGYGVYFQHRNTRTFPIKNLVDDSGRTLVWAKYDYPKGYQELEKKSAALVINTMLA